MCINAPNSNLFSFIFKLNMFQIVLLHEILLSTPRDPFKSPYYITVVYVKVFEQATYLQVLLEVPI